MIKFILYKKEAYTEEMTKFRGLAINLIYLLILIPLLYIAISVIYQSITKPGEIPNIFGYKLFMILDSDAEQVKYGDLVFTKNVNQDVLQEGETIAIREVSDNKVTFIKSDEKDSSTKIEGLLIKRIPKIGSVLYFIQQPIPMISICIAILSVGGVWIYIAGKLDKRDIELAEEKIHSKD